MKYVFMSFIFFSLFSSISLAKCTYKNYTGVANKKLRDEVYANMQNIGTRLALKGMKNNNLEYGPGTVDEKVINYQKLLCAQLSKDVPEGIVVKMIKMDFKGYYITCSPDPKCGGAKIEKIIKKVPKPIFPADETHPLAKKFEIMHAPGKNYQDGYIKTRVTDSYPAYDKRKKMNNPHMRNFDASRPVNYPGQPTYDPSTPLHKFLEKEMNASILEATAGIIEADDPKFIAKLDDAIADVRAGNVKKIDPKLYRLIVTIDNLEIPFSGSNDFDEEMKKAIKDEPNKRGISTTSAQSGDDKTMIVKENGKMVKAVGIDAKGLGSLNNTARLEEYVKFLKSEKEISSMADIFKISDGAIKLADKKMERSMVEYHKILDENLRRLKKKGRKGMSMEQVLAATHKDYVALQKAYPEKLMEMRSGAIDPCGSTQCTMDKIGVIHNNLKLMEKSGVTTHFGDSCIGTEYWVRKNGLRAATSLK